MLNTVRGVVRAGKIELLEKIDVVEGSELLITILPQEETEFWMRASNSSLDQVWANTEDDIYAELLKA
jgi:hypothetical protein